MGQKIRIKFPKKENQEMTQNKTVQPGTKRHQEERKALQEDKMERL
jgi:hypothetical protein